MKKIILISIRSSMAIALMSVFSQMSQALIVYNNAFAISQQNNIVRVRGSDGSLGSGTVIDTHAGTGGTWFCVLTADHVVDSGSYDGGGVSIGGLYNNDFVGTYTQLHLGENTALTGLANAIDLAVADVFVPNAQLASLPSMGSITLGGGNANSGNQAVMAGYGRYYVSSGINAGTPYFTYSASGTYGTYNSGFNNYTAVSNGRTHGIYTEDDWQSKARFDVNAGSVTQVYSYIENGDSGGPTFMSNGSGGLNLVGVHVTAQDTGDVSRTVYQGYEQYDINVNSYLDFINGACNAVPEPASLLPLGMCSIALVFRRRRR